MLCRHSLTSVVSVCLSAGQPAVWLDVTLASCAISLFLPVVKRPRYILSFCCLGSLHILPRTADAARVKCKSERPKLLPSTAWESLLTGDGSINKVKVAHTRLPSVGSRFLVSLQTTWVINPAVGCHYFPPGPQLPWQPLRELIPISLHDGCEQFA